LAFYPASLDLKGQICLVAGGGKVAYRKVSMLLGFQASVVVVAPEVIDPLYWLAEQGEVKFIRDVYRPEYLDKVFLVFGATGNAGTNRQIAREAGERGSLVNIADSPELCTFMVPSVVNRGDLTISISTGGKSPALARSLREKMENEYGRELEELTRFLGAVRHYLISNWEDAKKRKEVLNCLGDIRAAGFYQSGDREMFEKAVWDYIKEWESRDK